MPIKTVTGDITVEKAGYILPHEHIFCDLRPLVSNPGVSEFNERLSLTNHGLVTRYPYALLDNALIDEADVQVEELKTFKKQGGGLIVDATTECFGRSPNKLKAVSEASGVNVVMGSGYYVGAMHPGYIKGMTENEISNIIIHDITQGVGDTGICSGIIGEIGTGSPISDEEMKVVRAAAAAQTATGAGMHIHTDLYSRSGYDAAKTAVECGAQRNKICIDHTDVVLDMDYMERILQLGVMLEFDNFGKEYYIDKRFKTQMKCRFAYDLERVAVIKKLIEAGYAEQIMITNDICLKSMTHRYGGWGYDHIIINIIPMMLENGIDEESVRRITLQNPTEFLDIKN